MPNSPLNEKRTSVRQLFAARSPQPKAGVASSFAAIVYCLLDRHRLQTAKSYRKISGHQARLAVDPKTLASPGLRKVTTPRCDLDREGPNVQVSRLTCKLSKREQANHHMEHNFAM
jgi:hypothetical protein